MKENNLKGFSLFKQKIYLNQITFVQFKQNIFVINKHLFESNNICLIQTKYLCDK